MGDDTEYDLKTWKEVFAEISYAYESQYEVEYWERNGVEYVTVYKGTFNSDGEYEYKGNTSTFDPALWPRVKLFAKLFEEGGTVDLLYGDKDE